MPLDLTVPKFKTWSERINSLCFVVEKRSAQSKKHLRFLLYMVLYSRTWVDNEMTAELIRKHVGCLLPLWLPCHYSTSIVAYCRSIVSFIYADKVVCLCEPWCRRDNRSNGHSEGCTCGQGWRTLILKIKITIHVTVNSSSWVTTFLPSSHPSHPLMFLFSYLS